MQGKWRQWRQQYVSSILGQAPRIIHSVVTTTFEFGVFYHFIAAVMALNTH